MIALFSDGSSAFGLGNIGLLAVLPMLEDACILAKPLAASMRSLSAWTRRMLRKSSPLVWNYNIAPVLAAVVAQAAIKSEGPVC